MIKVVFSVAWVAAVFALCAAQYLRRRRQKASSNVCYLENELKPQNSFKRVLADNSYTPFKHLKLNESDKESSSNLHPYREEIEALLENPLIDFAFVSTNVDLEMSSSYVWVGTESQLEELVDVLRKETVIAVDTEQHSLRSFLGFTALMQISTQEEDYLLDTIALHDIMGILRPVFANPSICKVFHGADNDVLWLQRDFHIYVVNLFDTAKVCDVLSKPQKSLSYLLETYCGVTTNKLLQREDWRQRPLTEEMVQYACTDTHFLLYIANCLINELKTQVIAFPGDKSQSILEANRRSNMVCLQLYTKEIEASPGDSAASSIFSRYLNSQGGDLSRSFETQDLVQCLCMWRDLMARVHDESLRYVLSDQAIVMLASRTPKTQTEIYDTIAEADLNSDPLIVGSSPPSPSPVVHSHLEDLLQIMQYKMVFPEDIALRILKKHLGPNGSCLLSLFNFSLLSKSNLKPANGLFAQQNGGKSARQVGRKASRELFVQKFSCKSPVYHNCRIYASDGRLLCYCDRRKLEWYLRRDLAKLVENDPPAIMLLFEPKGRPEDEDNDFYIQSKKNICVGCGEGNHYLRYRLIPSCYRMHFPEHLKSHRSHDIVLLCVDCHEIAHSAAEKYKKKIAEEYGIPLFVRKVVDLQQTSAIPELSGSVGNLEEAGVSPLQLRTAAMALLRHGPKMPSRRREELTQTVMKYFGGKELSERDLERALLVGMSPHERRKLEKKRGLRFEHSSWTVSSSKAQENNADTMSTSAVSEILEVNSENEADTHDRAKNSKQGDVDSSVEMENFVIDILHSYADVNGKSAATGSTGTKSDTSRVFENQNVRVLGANNGDEIRPPNRTVSAYCLSHETASPEYNPKMSLLGHGPHGKQVVDHLIKEYGEEGIRQFCQKWRQVFVEAIHPRFLPTGWDVMHSGRREFGEYSVYNPSNKA